jgi:ABC-type transporter Mla subunit MlaD
VIHRVRAAALFTIVLVSFGSGCVSFHAPGFATPAPRRSWPGALADAQVAAAKGRYAEADSLLADFARSYVGSDEAAETAYWRALFKMDPANAGGSLSDAIASLNAYLADARPRQHVVEATVIKRVATALDEANRAAAEATEQARNATTTASAAKAQAADAQARADAKSDGVQSADAEIKRLKEELAKANAELERIRKRLAQPSSKPPTEAL